jgi:hypothetical protein
MHEGDTLRSCAEYVRELRRNMPPRAVPAKSTAAGLAAGTSGGDRADRDGPAGRRSSLGLAAPVTATKSMRKGLPDWRNRGGDARWVKTSRPRGWNPFRVRSLHRMLTHGNPTRSGYPGLRGATLSALTARHRRAVAFRADAGVTAGRLARAITIEGSRLTGGSQAELEEDARCGFNGRKSGSAFLSPAVENAQ